MTRLNGHHHTPAENTVPRSTYDKLRRKCDALEIQIRTLMFSKSQLEERIAEERQIHAVDREIWRMREVA